MWLSSVSVGRARLAPPGQLTDPGGPLGPYAQFLEPAGVFAVAFVAVVAVGYFLLDPAVERLLERREVDPTAELVFRRSTRVGYLAVGGFVGVALAGFEVLAGGSALVLAAVTFTLGVAGQDAVGNFVSGVFLVLDRNFSVGDFIRWNDRSGTVKDIGFRVTRVRTIDNEILTVPNTELATAAITTPYNGATHRTTLPLGIGYDDDPDEATRILVEAAHDQPDILSIPSPAVRLTEFAGSHVALEVQYWVADPREANLLRIRSTYARAAKRRLEDAGLSVMPPSKHDLSGTLTVEGAQRADGDGGGVRISAEERVEEAPEEAEHVPGEDDDAGDEEAAREE
jgi:small-conductance mechanosensitive channel